MRALPLVAFLASVALGCSSSSSGSGSSLVIDHVDNAGGIQAPKTATGYEATVVVTAHASGTIVSARIDFPSDDPPRLVGSAVPVNQKSLSASTLQIPIDKSAGPGTGDGNLVLVDDANNVAKSKIVVTMSP